MLLEAPARHEAGTQDTAAAVAWAAACQWLAQFGFDRISEHEAELGRVLREGLEALAVRVLGPGRGSPSILSFTIDGVHAHDLDDAFDDAGISVRSGHMCAQPYVRRLGVTSATRASLGVYNNRRDVDALLGVVEAAVRNVAPGVSRVG
jgi:cysteine desulfurase/selenocysteine lyase